MKKNYIVPSCKEFQVRPVEMIAISGDINNDATDNWGNTKEEKEQGSGIWNLYE